MADAEMSSRDELIERTGKNLAGALAELAEMAIMAEQQSRSVRRGIATDVRALIGVAGGMSEADLAQAVVTVANRFAPELGVSASPSDALVPVDQPVFEVLDHCGQRPGAGVIARFGAVTVSLSVAGSMNEGLTGGGFDLTVEY